MRCSLAFLHDASGLVPTILIAIKHFVGATMRMTFNLAHVHRRGEVGVSIGFSVAWRLLPLRLWRLQRRLLRLQRLLLWRRLWVSRTLSERRRCMSNGSRMSYRSVLHLQAAQNGWCVGSVPCRVPCGVTVSVATLADGVVVPLHCAIMHLHREVVESLGNIRGLEVPEEEVEDDAKGEGGDCNGEQSFEPIRPRGGSVEGPRRHRGRRRRGRRRR